MKKPWIKVMIITVVAAIIVFAYIENAARDKSVMNANAEEIGVIDEAIVNDMDREQENIMNSDTAQDQLIEDITAENASNVTTTLLTNKGEMAPDFEFVDSSGNVYTNETFSGEKVYLKYWASWCSICLAGLDEINTLFAEAEGFTVYTVVTPYNRGELSQEDFEVWFSGLEQKNIKVLFDMKGQAAEKFGVRAFPTQIFIGSDGVLISSLPGHQSNKDIINFIDTFY